MGMGEQSAKWLTLAVVESGKVPVVKCSGRLVAGETDRFYAEIKELMAAHKEIVLDLAAVTHMDSMGLGTLARLYVHGKSVGSVLELMNVGKPVRQLLGITHMLSVFRIVGETGIRMG
jgi:anti-anti-sigma factor